MEDQAIFAAANVHATAPAPDVVHETLPPAVSAPSGEGQPAVDACFAQEARESDEALQAMLLLLPALGGCHSREERDKEEKKVALDWDERPEND